LDQVPDAGWIADCDPDCAVSRGRKAHDRGWNPGGGPVDEGRPDRAQSSVDCAAEKAHENSLLQGLGGGAPLVENVQIPNNVTKVWTPDRIS